MSGRRERHMTLSFSEIEQTLQHIINLARREAQSRRYAQALERSLLERGILSEASLEAVAAEAHAIAALETAFDPMIEHLQREGERFMETLWSGVL